MTTVETTVAADLKSHFATLEDPRDGNAQLHNLLDIVLIAVCAVICGANAWTEVEAFGHAKRAWLETFLELPQGIPSHDTFGRVFRHLDPLVFERCFRQWTNAIQQRTAGQVIAFDGKCLRRSGDALLGKAAIYMVSAWATADHLVLGQRKVDEKSNEITAIPALLQLLDVRGCIVSIDAIGTQKAIAAQVVAQEGDSVDENFAFCRAVLNSTKIGGTYAKHSLLAQKGVAAHGGPRVVGGGQCGQIRVAIIGMERKVL